MQTTVYNLKGPVIYTSLAIPVTLTLDLSIRSHSISLMYSNLVLQDLIFFANRIKWYLKCNVHITTSDAESLHRIWKSHCYSLLMKQNMENDD